MVLAICNIGGVDAGWGDYVDGLPGSQGVKADTNRELSLLETVWMSRCAYCLNKHDTVTAGGADCGGDTYQKKLVPLGWKEQEEDSGRQSGEIKVSTQMGRVVFVHEGRKLAVLTYKGMDTSDSEDKDIVVFKTFLGAEPLEQLKDAVRLVKKYQGKGYNVMVTGHSLGGYMAEIVATRLQISGVGYCAPGTHTINPLSYDHGGDAHDGFQNINFENDKLGNLMPGIYTHAQWSVFVTESSDVHEHGITAMTEAMECRSGDDWEILKTYPYKEGIWTNLNVVSKCTSGVHGYYTDCQPKVASTGLSMGLEPSFLTIYAVVGAGILLVVQGGNM